MSSYAKFYKRKKKMHHFNRQSNIYIHTLGYDVYDIVFLLNNIYIGVAVLRPTVLVLGALCSVIE